MQHHLKLDQMTGIQLSIIENRLELLQRTDSEDPLLFRLCSQHILHWMLTHEDEAKQCIASHIHHEPYVSATSEEVYTHLVQGISQMIHLVHRDGIAFWRNGCVQEQQYLVQDIQRHRLPADHPEHFKAPHLSALEREQKLEIQMTLKDLRQLAQSGKLSKDVRTTVNQLPDSPKEE